MLLVCAAPQAPTAAAAGRSGKPPTGRKGPKKTTKDKAAAAAAAAAEVAKPQNQKRQQQQGKGAEEEAGDDDAPMLSGRGTTLSRCVMPPLNPIAVLQTRRVNHPTMLPSLTRQLHTACAMSAQLSITPEATRVLQTICIEC